MEIRNRRILCPIIVFHLPEILHQKMHSAHGLMIQNHVDAVHKCVRKHSRPGHCTRYVFTHEQFHPLCFDAEPLACKNMTASIAYGIQCECVTGMQAMVLTHEDESSTGRFPYLRGRLRPLQVLEFIGRAARREPPCKPMFAVWHWMQDRILLHAQRCHVLPIDHNVSYTSRASRLHAYT